MDELEKILKESEERARKRVDMGEDIGHNLLLEHLNLLLKEVVEFQFHDFLNTAYGAPKAALHNKLSHMMSNVVEGKYDN